jgi:AcrR family transcriptional regulator
VVIVTVGPQLPRGRHSLTRGEVEQSQRLRIVQGVVEAMRDKGYVETRVADIIALAGISRETFYQHHTNKLDAFLAAVDLVGQVLGERLAGAIEEPGAPLERFERALTTYLEVLASQPGYARIILVETSAAGPEAMARRADIQQRIVDAIANLFGARSGSGRFACELLVASIGAMVTLPVVTGDVDRVRALGPLLMDQVRRWEAAGVFSSPRRVRRNA